jgi:hypothetical protein
VLAKICAHLALCVWVWVWCVVRGAWCVVRGAWCVVHDLMLMCVCLWGSHAGVQLPFSVFLQVCRFWAGAVQ